MTVSPLDWTKGVTLSVMASIIGGASKLAIRKSWLMIENLPDEPYPHTVKVDDDDDDDDEYGDDNDDDNGIIDYSHIIIPDTNNQQPRPNNNNNNNKRDNYHTLSTNNKNTFIPYPLGTPHAQEQITQWNHILKTRRRSKLLRWSGMLGMTVFNPACCVWAMEYASPSILAPFSGLTLVWIVLFSEYFVGERPLAVQVFAASLIILGEVVVAISGDHTNDDSMDSMERLIDSYKDPYFLYYFLILTIWMMAMLCLIQYGSPSARRFAWGVLGGSITGLQNFLKDALTIVKLTSLSTLPPLFYLFMLLAIASALAGLLFLTACMKRYDATYSSSMFVGSFVISASIMAAFHYDTFQNLEHLWNYVCYPMGLVILLLGIIILAQETEEDKDTSNGISGGGGKEQGGKKQPHGVGFGISTQEVDMKPYDDYNYAETQSPLSAIENEIMIPSNADTEKEFLVKYAKN